MRHGTSLQERRALRLHEKAEVAPGPCGLQEIAQFQKSLSRDISEKLFFV